MPSGKFKEFGSRIPSVTATVDNAVQKVLEERGGAPESVKANFSDYLEQIEQVAYGLYLEAERESWRTLASMPTAFEGPDWTFDEFYRLFQSISQSRRARAGSSFELVLRTLFRRLGYPFEEHQVVDGIPDFILPNADHYRRNPMDSVIFTAKRTLRERWRQVATEGTRGLGQFLGTIDARVTKAALAEMNRNRIYLVVPRSLKHKIAEYAESVTVMSFEEFFDSHLDPAVTRWRKAGVVQ